MAKGMRLEKTGADLDRSLKVYCATHQVPFPVTVMPGDHWAMNLSPQSDFLMGSGSAGLRCQPVRDIQHEGQGTCCTRPLDFFKLFVTTAYDQISQRLHC